jgi:hypothetical protein
MKGVYVMEPHVHIGSESFAIYFLSLPVALLIWRLIQLLIRNTKAGPAFGFIFH